jgi:elongation factor 1-beta
MGKVAVSFRIMPEGVEVDLGKLEAAVRKSLGARLKKLEVKPVAFGLKALEVIAVVDDASGEMEKMEAALGALPGVGGLETTEVTLL